MTTEELEALRYPIGRFVAPDKNSEILLEQSILAIQQFPEQLNTETIHLSEDQQNTPYRPNGWTVRQVIHHCADSHLNSYVRFRLALTENQPLVKTYDEELWAELPDAKKIAIQPSLLLLEGLHARWIYLLKSMQDEDWEKQIKHPEFESPIALWQICTMYAWHGKHHLSQIQSLKNRNGWQ